MKRRIAGMVALAGLLSAGVGCKGVKDSIDADQGIRAKSMAAGKTSCVDAATKRKGATGATDAQVDQFCTCITEKGIGKFSNTELAGIGVSGGHMSAEQQGRMDAAVKTCNTETFHR